MPGAEKNHLYTYIQPHTDYIAVSTDEQRYISMTRCQVNDCKGKTVKMCVGPNVVNNLASDQDTCESAYFRQITPPKELCDTRLSYVATSIWTEIPGTDRWIFVLPREEVMTFTCPGTNGLLEHEGTEYVQGTGLLTLPTKIQEFLNGVVTKFYLCFTLILNVCSQIFTITCKLLELPTHWLTRDVLSLQIQPSGRTERWLNSTLYCLVPHNFTYTDSQKFQVAANHLKRYCNLISSGIFNISYVASVLPYFALYLKDGNYNAILRKLIEKFSLNINLPTIIIYTMANIKKHQGQDTCKMMAEGIAHVVFSKPEKEEDNLKTLKKNILYASSYYILQEKWFSLLQLLSCFVELLTKDEAIEVKAKLVPNFSKVANKTEVQQYLDSFPY
ncbi:uncharacterized protein LOC124369518 [Homalodisca vitripennis]|uniref:uncharacterized protein LOC124369518 n=1 Tax=Homalodisca vitripennis TaxID=197043 RepID=UPI001EEC1932|nr:uncharacterized protein LOC124369518 [Homalodisca vitripennis]